MTKKEFSYVVISSSGDKLEQIYGVYKDVEGACYGARSALTTLFPKHGDEAKIIRCEIISTEKCEEPLASLRKIKILSHKNKDEWELIPKYHIGRKLPKEE